jgi:DNA uptake protein ComE-like DNA-binding protein
MSRRLYREFYLLPRGEQRGLIILSILLVLSLLFRVTVGLLPERVPEELKEFEQEAAMLLAALAEADSLRQHRQDSLSRGPTGYPAGRDYPSDQRRTRTYRVEPVDLNRADSADLLPLPGIGPVFAGRIIKYRNLLGGFMSPEQLGEVYGIPAETVARIRSRVFLDSTAVRQIRIDSASFRELLRHPYLEYEDVKALVEYRDFKGDIGSVNELRANHILPDSTLTRMDGYFDYR